MKTIGAAVFHRADERMQDTINGLSLNEDGLAQWAVSLAACVFLQTVIGSARWRVLATSSGGARRVVTERLTTLSLPVDCSL